LKLADLKLAKEKWMSDAAALSPEVAPIPVPEQGQEPVNATSVRLGQWLDTYSEVAAVLPILVGLTLTTRLQLRGAQALLVNLMVGAAVRQTIVSLKQQARDSSAPATLAAATATVPGATTSGATSEPQSAPTTAATEEAEEDYTIVHSVPGRIRLRVERLRGDRLYAKRLETLLREVAQVNHVRINTTAASLVIQYDPGQLSELDLGLRLLNILERAGQGENVTQS
jgi:hypothetical protein